jgi:DNA-binding winged helix-turn-helix (wHTH) protein/TolB-like protein
MARLRLNGRTLDLERAELCDLDGAPVPLRQQALAVLLELAHHPAQVVTKRELMERVWPGLVVTDDSLVQCIVEIRRQLGDSQQRIVRTLPRRGYMLVPEPAEAPAEAPRTPSRRNLIFAATAALIALTAAGVWLFSSLTAGAGHDKQGRDSDAIALAILPLRQIKTSADVAPPDGGGLAYMIAGELARNHDLHVVSTLVSESLRAKGMTVRQIGEQTGARYVVDGSVERRGDRLALEMSLVDTADDRIAWSGHFEPNAQELPGVTRMLLERICAALGSSARELRILASLNSAPASLDSHALALHGIALARDPFSREDIRRARLELERATQLDPNFAPAWAHLGMIKTLQLFWRGDEEARRRELPEAIADIRRAIALDPSLATSWRLLSYAIDSSEDAQGVLHAAERAVELGPGDPDNWLALGLAQYYSRNTEAGLRNVEKAVSWHRMQPALYSIIEARLRYAVSDYERAALRARECMERASAVVSCKAIWLSSQMRLGQAAEAEAAWPQLVSATPSLPAYRYAPRGSPEGQRLEEDLARLRARHAP